MGSGVQLALTDEEEQALRESLEQAQRSVTEQAAQVRKSQLTGLLKDLQAPARFADVYPADAELTSDALKAFVAEFAPPVPPATEASTKPDLSGWSAYERAQEGATTPGAGGKTELEQLLEEGMEGLKELTGGGLDWNHFQPPDGRNGSTDMRAKNAEYANKVNRANRTWEKEIRLGRSEPGGVYQNAMGFGGRVDPPRWAYKAADGQSD
jgi:hypothetical protein